MHCNSNHSCYSNKLKQIKSIKEMIIFGKLDLAKRKIKEFFDEFGSDYEMLYLYGKILRKLSHVNESILVFKNLIELLKLQTNDGYLNATYTELFKVYFINEYYEEAYQTLLSGNVNLNDNRLHHGNIPELNIFKKVLEIRMDIYKEQENEDEITNRLLHYDRDREIKHIRRHKYLELNNDNNNGVFDNVDIIRLFDNVEKVLGDSKKLQMFSINDLYLFDFPRIGTNNCDKLLVVTNKGTNEIVTMYPTNAIAKMPINNNLYELYLEKDENKIKKLSQIDRFNKRYNIK